MESTKNQGFAVKVDVTLTYLRSYRQKKKYH